MVGNTRGGNGWHKIPGTLGLGRVGIVGIINSHLPGVARFGKGWTPPESKGQVLHI